MTITFRITFWDRLAFAAYHLPRNPLLILVSLLLFLMVTFGAIVPAVREGPPGESKVVRALAFGVVEALLVLCIVAMWTVIAVLTMISRRNKPLLCQRTMTLREDAFVTESEYGRSETRWTIVQKLARTRWHILMYVAQESAVVIPRCAFASSTEWDAFYDYCWQRTSGAKPLQPTAASPSDSSAGGSPGNRPPSAPSPGACG